MIVGLTGSIASGKTIVSGMIEEWGVRVVDSDLLAREVTDRNPHVLRKIRRWAGDDVFNERGELDRPALARQMFADPALKIKLQGLLHPLIKRRILEEAKRARRKPEHLVVVVPLLFETGFTQPFDEVWVTSAPLRVRIARLLKRDGLSTAEARQRDRVQMPQADKVRRADLVIDTNVPLPRLKQSLARLCRSRFSASP